MTDRPSLRQIGRIALDEVSELLGYPTEGITGVRRFDDGWIVTVEVRELDRIPETTDVLASYEATVDAEGHVIEYRRVRRYLRSQIEGV